MRKYYLSLVALQAFLLRSQNLMISGHRLLQETEPLPRRGGGRESNFDSNMVIILAALLCALVCVLGINSVVRCVLRCVGRREFHARQEQTERFAAKGLKKAVLMRMPVAVYGSEGEGRFTECAICLGEFLDGEKIRVLPKCQHCFHVKCVDVWLASHSSCPNCRQTVAEEPVESGREVVVDVDIEVVG